MSLKNERLSVLLCMFVHFNCILTRLNISINLSEIIESGYLNEYTATIVLNAGLIGFGAGQLISGFLADRFNPSKIILISLILTGITNIIFIFPSSLFLKTTVWFVNCLICSFLWPPLIKYMSVIFSENQYKKHSFLISIGSSLGSLVLYLISPLLITFYNFKVVFITTGFFSIILGLFWYFNNIRINAKKNDINSRFTYTFLSKKIIAVFAVFIVIMILHGGIRDYIISWFPYYLHNKFEIESKDSILICLLFPIVSIFCSKLILTVNKNFISNEITCVGILFILASGFIFLINIFVNKYLSVIFAGLAAGFADSVNFIMTCLVPVHFKTVGKVSSVAGFLNTFTYLGVPIFSLFGVSLIEDSNFILLFKTIALLGVFAAFVTILTINPFKKIKATVIN